MQAGSRVILAGCQERVDLLRQPFRQAALALLGIEHAVGGRGVTTILFTRALINLYDIDVTCGTWGLQDINTSKCMLTLGSPLKLPTHITHSGLCLVLQQALTSFPHGLCRSQQNGTHSDYTANRVDNVQLWPRLSSCCHTQA